MSSSSQNKIPFIDFMLSPTFLEFNNVDHEKQPPMNPIIQGWDTKTLTNNIAKINRELLRRDAHGAEETPFSESNAELHLLLYSTIMYLKHRLDNEPS